MQLPSESKKECRYQGLQVVVSCQKRVMESPPRKRDALFTGESSLQRSANYLFVFETVRIRHHMYSYPSDEGLYSQFLHVCDSYLTDIPDRKGLVSSWSQQCQAIGSRRRWSTEIHILAASKDRGPFLVTVFFQRDLVSCSFQNLLKYGHQQGSGF